METYLSNKYGLYTPSATWFNQSPYLMYKAEIIKNQWNEAQPSAYVALQNNNSGVVTNDLVSWFAADQANGIGNSLPNDGPGQMVTRWFRGAKRNAFSIGRLDLVS